LTLPEALSRLPTTLIRRRKDSSPRSRWRAAALRAIGALAVAGAPAWLEAQAPSEQVLISGDAAYTWTEGRRNVLLIEGPATIQLDDAELSADNAVVWIDPAGDASGQLDLTIALLGEATVRQGGIERAAPALKVGARLRGRLRVTANTRLARDRSDTEIYRDARALPQASADSTALLAPPAADASGSRAGPSTQPVTPTQRFDFSFGELRTLQTADGTTAAVLTGGITLLERRPDGGLLELRADRAVLFTSLSDLGDVADPQTRARLEQSIRSAYLEGDVRLNLTPASLNAGEQRLRAQRVYYEFGTDRAVLTEAVLHTTDPTIPVPVTLRAQTIKQLAEGEWLGTNAQLSTSEFAVPGYSLSTSRVYVQRVETGDTRFGSRTNFDARNVTLDAYGLPFFYVPIATGSVTERGAPLRRISLENSSTFGTGVRTDWGLLDLLGASNPENLDLTLKLDYLSERGPAIGIDGVYEGGYVTQTTRQPWTFQGDVTSYLVLDDGVDRLGRDRARIPHENELRGRIRWEHQHFFPDDWQLQARASWVSDGTFLEEWYEREFDNGEPNDVSLYLKRQRQSEALTLLVQGQPNDVVTSADELQEVTPLVDPTLGVAGQFPFVTEKLPEVGYRLIGESFARDDITVFSENTVAGMRFNVTRDPLSELGFRNRRPGTDDEGNPVLEPAVLPGYPATGYTGFDDNYVGRGDFRQQLDLPFSAGAVKVVPYVFGRYTGYTDSPGGGSVNRLMAGAGVRVGTSFWRVYDAAESSMLDVNRLRHVVEPEVHVFTSAATEDREDVFVYEQDVDGVSDISAVQFAVGQRWQTKRGGPGRWRSVDFLTLNARATVYANAPDDPVILDENGNPFAPTAFRGVFFGSLPEASIARDSLSGDLLWRVTDTTSVLGDTSYNLETGTLATAALGVAAQRGERMSYYVGTRYVGEVNHTLLNAAATYEITAKYSVALAQSFDLAERSSQSTSATLVRRFDRFFAALTIYFDQLEDEGGFSFTILPDVLGNQTDSTGLSSFLMRN
jgi:hypothetical protein